MILFADGMLAAGLACECARMRFLRCGSVHSLLTVKRWSIGTVLAPQPQRIVSYACMFVWCTKELRGVMSTVRIVRPLNCLLHIRHGRSPPVLPWAL